MGEFFCPENEFLVFEEGPGMDFTLQWATYCFVHIEYQFEGTLPVYVYQCGGRLVRSAELDFKGNLAFMDLSGLPQEIYVVTGTDAGGKRHFVEKVVRR